MRSVKTKHITIAIIFIWIGFVTSISFMEAWLKFLAPGITRALGLGIGKLVFSVLNKVEITFAISITILLLTQFKKSNLSRYHIVVLLTLVIQTIWLLPALEDRANMIITGIDVPDSNIHLSYIFLEFIKVISLGLFGKTLLNQYYDNR